MTKERNQSIDLIKIIAMYGVIALHSTHDYIGGEFCPSFVAYSLAVCAIPLFFCVSGYLLLGREYSWSYPIKKIIGVFRFVAIASIIFWCLNKQFTLNAYIDLCFGSYIAASSLYQFWYFGSMIIIYLLLPLLNYIYKKRRLFIICLIGLGLIECGVFAAILRHGAHIEGNITQTFRLWNHIFYFMLGGCLHRYRFSVHWSAIPICAAVVVMMQYFCNGLIGTTLCEYYYSSVPVMLFVVSIFVVVLNLNIKGNWLIRELSVLFLPVYTFHIYIIGSCNRHVPEALAGNGIVIFLAACIASTLFSYLWMKIPGMKKVFKI